MFSYVYTNCIDTKINMYIREHVRITSRNSYGNFM